MVGFPVVFREALVYIIKRCLAKVTNLLLVFDYLGGVGALEEAQVAELLSSFGAGAGDGLHLGLVPESCEEA